MIGAGLWVAGFWAATTVGIAWIAIVDEWVAQRPMRPRLEPEVAEALMRRHLSGAQR